MGWTNTQTDSITLPPDAGPTDARIEISPDIPAELQAFYVWNGTPVVGAILHYTGDGSYYYDADLTTDDIVDGDHAHARGFVAAGIVHEYEFTYLLDGGMWGIYNVDTRTQFTYGTPDRLPDRAAEYILLHKSMTLHVWGGLEIESPTTIFDGMWEVDAAAQFQSYDIKGDNWSSLLWDGPAIFTNTVTVTPQTVTSGITDIQSGVTVQSFVGKRAAGVVTIWITYTPTVGITATDGNIPDKWLCSIPVAWAPPYDTECVWSDGYTDGAGTFYANGKVLLRTSTATIIAGRAARIGITYVE